MTLESNTNVKYAYDQFYGSLTIFDGGGCSYLAQ